MLTGCTIYQYPCRQFAFPYKLWLGSIISHNSHSFIAAAEQNTVTGQESTIVHLYRSVTSVCRALHSEASGQSQQCYHAGYVWLKCKLRGRKWNVPRLSVGCWRVRYKPQHENTNVWNGYYCYIVYLVGAVIQTPRIQIITRWSMFTLFNSW